MKILIITPRFHTNLYYRVRALQSAGHEVSLISFYKGNSECHDVVEPKIIGYSWCTVFLNRIINLFKKTHLKSFWELKFSIPNIRKLTYHIKEINPDVILLKDFQSLSELLSLYYAKKFKKKVIMLIQLRKNTLFNSESLFRRYLKLLSYLGVVYFVSPTKEGEHILKNSGVRNVSHIPFVIDTKDFKKSYVSENTIRILSIGKFVPRKDHITLLRAISRLKNKYNIELTLVGERADAAYLRGVYDFIRAEYLNEFVQIKFNLDYKESLDEYKKNDLFILPSYDEPAAYSLVEAMAAQLPVICSDDCGTKCYIKEGENGYIFKNKNYKDLAQKIELIIKDRNYLSEMGQKSFSMVHTHHSLDFFNQEFSKIIQ
ncbi:hypothetical protein COB64_00550 [Candidatus Wolfebacteria bacterium]|nr:MAG: hypothetical protein COB64_00550 [Candidatus Wolfebacteria bacterium]